MQRDVPRAVGVARRAPAPLGRKRLHHPIVGDLDLDYESMELPSEPGLALNVYTAPAGTPSADALQVLASWVATHDAEPALAVAQG